MLVSFQFQGTKSQQGETEPEVSNKAELKKARSSVDLHGFMRTCPVIIVLSYTDQKMRPLVSLCLEFENTELHIL